jgi:hypothetical protein
VIDSVSNSLEGMGVQQYLMAFLFMGSYVMALSQFSGSRGRGYAAAIACVSALSFIVLNDPWENGVLVVAFGLITVGGLAAAVWVLWAFLCWQQARGGTAASHARDDSLSTVAAALDLLVRPRRIVSPSAPPGRFQGARGSFSLSRSLFLSRAPALTSAPLPQAREGEVPWELTQ